MMNKLYKTTIVQYYDFYISAPDEKIAEELSREWVTWDDHSSECVIDIQESSRTDTEGLAAATYGDTEK